MVLVKNPTKRAITVVITHQDAPKTDVAFQQPMSDPRTGETSERRVDRRLPESVTLLGGEERELPDYARKEARAAGLEIVKKPDESTEKKPEQPAKSERDTRAQKSGEKKKGSE